MQLHYVNMLNLCITDVGDIKDDLLKSLQAMADKSTSNQAVKQALVIIQHAAAPNINDEDLLDKFEKNLAKLVTDRGGSSYLSIMVKLQLIQSIRDFRSDLHFGPLFHPRSHL